LNNNYLTPTHELLVLNKNILPLLLVIFFFTGWKTVAQDVTTITANSDDISDNLDLEAVASIFGESKDIEDFEKRLNDPNTQISNLDLNNDGEVDYLRVMETAEKNLHSISVQAVLGKDQYQEVAVIDVEKDTKGTTQVQVVGNVDMYGPNYYITPYYPVVPVFFTLFWVAAYRPWYSPWYWGYRPPYFSPWRPYPPHIYRSNVHVHVNINNTYNRNNVRINNRTRVNTRDNAYFKNNPDKSFNKRNPGSSNRNELVTDRKSRPANKGINTDKGYKSSGRPVKKPATKPTQKPSTRPSNKASKSRPSTKPSTRPSYSKPAKKPNTRPTTRPSTSRPAAKPSNRSSPSRQSSRPSNTRRPAPRTSYTRTRH